MFLFYRKNHTENIHRILAPKDDDPSEQNYFVLLLDKLKSNFVYRVKADSFTMTNLGMVFILSGEKSSPSI